MSLDRGVNGDLQYPLVRAQLTRAPLAVRRRLLPELRVSSPALVAASGFLAGAATLATLRAARTRRRLRQNRKRTRSGIERRSVVATRSFLVDVHLLGR